MQLEEVATIVDEAWNQPISRGLLWRAMNILIRHCTRQTNEAGGVESTLLRTV